MNSQYLETINAIIIILVKQAANNITLAKNLANFLMYIIIKYIKFNYLPKIYYPSIYPYAQRLYGI